MATPASVPAPAPAQNLEEETTTIIIQNNSGKEVNHKILCCICGASIPPNPANMCLNCIRGQVDISDGIAKQEMVMFCKGCERYLQPPKYWLKAELESRELLHLCLKRIKGLNKLKLIDANFIWTEPHSRRLKIRITVQKEVFNGTILQQSFVVEFIVGGQQCEACERSHTEKTWKAIVQVRQHVGHKRTMFFLEQLILKHNMHENCINIKERPDGIDFYFNHKSHAQKLVHFLSSHCPTKVKTSERLITHDPQSNIFNFKYSFSVEIAPICREDAICLSKSYSKSLGGLGPMVICYKFNSNIYLMEPYSLRLHELAGPLFWKSPFRPMLTTKHLVEFTVIDVEPVKPRVEVGKWLLVEAQVVKTEDPDNIVMFTKSHLGHILKAGDTVLGYDVKNTNANDINMDDANAHNLPDVILIRKVYSKANKRRNWKIKQLAKKEQENMKKGDIAKREEDMNRFLEELEEDPEMRSNVKLYKAKDGDIKAKKAPAKKAEEEDEEEDEEEEEKPKKKKVSIAAPKKTAKKPVAVKKAASKPAAPAAEKKKNDGEGEDADDDDEWEDIDEDAPAVDDKELLDEEEEPVKASDKHTAELSDEDLFEDEEEDFDEKPKASKKSAKPAAKPEAKDAKKDKRKKK